MSISVPAFKTYIAHPRHAVYASAIGMVVALGYLFVPAIRYQYTTDIYLGESWVGGAFQPLENTMTAFGIIKDSILPSPDAELKKEDIRDLEANVFLLVVENGRAIRLRSEGDDGGLENIELMHRFVAERALDHLKRREVLLRNRAGGRLQSAKQSLENANRAMEVYSADLAQTTANEAKLGEEIKALSGQIADEEKRNSNGSALAPSGVAQVEDGSVALGKRGQLARYKQLELASLPERLGEYQRRVAEASQSAADSQLRISDLNVDVASIDPPRIARFAERSVRPVGPRKATRLIGGFIVGFLAYFGALTLWELAKRRFLIA